MSPLEIISPPGSSGGGGAPSGAAGGALAGTYPNPDIADAVLQAADKLADSLGYLSLNMDPALASTNVVLATAGTTYLAKLAWPYKTKNLTAIDFGLQSNGVGLVGGQCWVLVYHSNGTLLGQVAAEATVFVGGAAAKSASIAVAAANLPAVGQGGFIWAGFVFNGTTGPGISRAPNAQPQAIVNMNLAVAASRFATGPTGITATPAASFNPATLPLVPVGGISLMVGAK